MIDAMKQALEALEELMPTGTATLHLRENAIATLRQAIAEAEKEATLQEISDIGQWDTSDMAYRPNGLSVEQEPVAWMEDSIEFYAKDHPTNSCTIPLYTAPPSKPWVGLTDDEIHKIIDDCTPNNAAQVELSDFAKAISNAEAKLKEKNNE
jgi:hypothetical protein